MIEIDFHQLKDHLRIRRVEGKRYLFDPIRSKWLVLQPEELVRQLFVQYLLREKGYNRNRIALEKGLTVNTLYKRCDVLVFDRDLSPFLLVECKAPQVAISQETFRQIATYNLPLNVRFLVVTNGIVTFCCSMDYQNQTYEFVPEIPVFPG